MRHGQIPFNLETSKTVCFLFLRPFFYRTKTKMFPIFFTIWYNTSSHRCYFLRGGWDAKRTTWDKMESIDLGKVINLQNKLVPEMVQLLTERYSILRQISHDQPIGRRSLARKLSLSERVLRSHVDFLKEAGLLEFGLRA
mgnify:FL=1